ncbi:MAG TPA: hypothetical protein PL051_00570 [Candidatus Saccharibacteria bacterium]|nr:hypothetical protein [Candidatus Saccharibacteria bacterium]
MPKNESPQSKLLNRLRDVMDSKRVTWIVITLLVIQALWIAFSFRFPMIYDETAHVNLIQTYSSQISPYTEDAPANMTVQVSLYHYLLSFVYRTVQLGTENLAVQILLLRVINIAFFAIGLILAAKLMRKIQIRYVHINIGLLLFVLLPVTSLVAATINYDNLLFPLTMLYLLLAIDLLQSKKPLNWHNVFLLISVGCLTALVKYTFLPIFAASILAIIVYLLLARRTYIVKGLKNFSAQLTLLLRGKSIALMLALVLIVGLFMITYARNVLVYGSVKPSCVQLHTTEECLNNGIVKRNREAEATASKRPVGDIVDFTKIWTRNMVTMTGMTGNSTESGAFVLRKPLPLITLTIYGGIIASIIALVFAWRYLNASVSWYFVAGMFVMLVASVYVVNAIGYYRLHAAYANQPRYILSLLPIYLTMAVVAVSYLTRYSRTLRWSIFAVVLILFTQGGGLVTHIVRSDSSWYWNSPAVRQINTSARGALTPLVKE